MATVEVFSRSDKPGRWCPIKGQVQCIQSKHTIIVLQPKPTKQQIYSHSVLNLPSCFFLTTRHAHWLLYSNKKLSISILSYPAIQILGSSATLEILYSGAIEQSCWLNCDFAKNSPIHSVMCKTNIGSMANPPTGQCCITLSDLTSVHLTSLFTLPTFCLHLIVLSIFIPLIFSLLTFPTLVHFLNYPIHSGGWVAQLYAQKRMHARAHNYDKYCWIFVMTGLTEPLVIGGSAGKGEGHKRVIIPPP